jgi:hypothetical protein
VSAVTAARATTRPTRARVAGPPGGRVTRAPCSARSAGPRRRPR